MITFEIPTKKLDIVIGITGVLFLGLAFLVMNGSTEGIDKSILLFLRGARSSSFNGLFLFLTYLGSAPFISLATVCLSLVLLIKKRFSYFFHVSLTVLTTSGLVFFLKQIFERIRPAEILAVYQETSYSFPSGHTSLSVVFYGTLAYLLAEKYADKKLRIDFLFGWIFFMIMIGFSRMYLGVHYASDVLGGYLIGFLCLSLGVLLFEKYTKKESAK